MTPDWVQPAIAAGAGLGGALIGGGAVLLNGRSERRAVERKGRLEALWAFYAAASAWASFANRQPQKRNWLEQFGFHLEEQIHSGTMIRRLFKVTDAVWSASARVRTVANDEELLAIDRIERLVGETELFAPIAEEWGPAISEYRALLRKAGGHKLLSEAQASEH